MTVEEVQTKLGDEDIRKILEKLDPDKMMRFLVDMIAMLGDIAVKLGEIEEENKEIPEIIRIIGTNPKLFLSKLVEQASAEEVKALVYAMLKLDELAPKMSKLFVMNPEEKKEIGRQLINLSGEIKEAYEKAKEKRR